MELDKFGLAPPDVYTPEVVILKNEVADWLGFDEWDEYVDQIVIQREKIFERAGY